MKYLSVKLAITIMLLSIFNTNSRAEIDAARLFQMNCMACHTIGQGTMVGPDLKGTVFNHEKDWLIKFISSSQTMIQNGDPVANKLYEEWNQIIMPDFAHMSNEEIVAIIDYIAEQSGGWPVKTTKTSSEEPDESELADATEEEIKDQSQSEEAVAIVATTPEPPANDKIITDERKVSAAGNTSTHWILYILGATALVVLIVFAVMANVIRTLMKIVKEKELAKG